MDKLGEKGLQWFQKQAANSISDKNKLGRIINLALRKGMKKKELKDAWKNVLLLIDVVRDWKDGSYRDIPKRTIILLVAALLYLVTPVDMVPDFIPLTGLLDDVTVIGFVVNQVSQELEKYKAWKESLTSGFEENSEMLELDQLSQD
ncbi:YkvA family protein [Desulfitobacterium sp. Sab5]|uniref:YkvA family protein n=1 Tax=Desulfitobacterium nosdiversum TaxID=3375356 RepID=UPI003CF4F3DE